LGSGRQEGVAARLKRVITAVAAEVERSFDNEDDRLGIRIGVWSIRTAAG